MGMAFDFATHENRFLILLEHASGTQYLFLMNTDSWKWYYAFAYAINPASNALLNMERIFQVSSHENPVCQT